MKPFNFYNFDPDTQKAMLEWVGGWKLSPKFLKKLDEEYAKLFGQQPGAETPSD